MAGGKETPRQKMINMMYLILTAMLALNVSVDVLDAFHIVNEGLEDVNAGIDDKVDDYYNTFEQQYNKEPEKTANAWNKAQELRTKTDDIINFIETEIKLALIQENEGKTIEELYNPEREDARIILNPEEVDLSKDRRIFHKVDVNNLTSKDKYDNTTRFMIDEDNAGKLRNKVDEYRQFVVSTIESATNRNYDNNVGLRTDGNYEDKEGNSISWEMHHFNHMIPSGAISLLNELTGEIKMTEYDAITELYKSINAGDFKFSTLEARVFPKSTYVLQGQPYEADVFIVASDDTKEFDAKYARGVKEFTKANANAVKTVSSENGVVKINIPTTAEGEQSFAGIIEMKDPVTGEIKPYPFQSSYTVAPPSATVSPTKMNVLYRGLENPISVSAPGFDSKDLTVTVDNGEIRKDGNKGEYLVTPGKENSCTVTVSSNVNGKKVVLNNIDFRIKPIPSPRPVVNGKSSGKLSKQQLLAANAVHAVMDDFLFDGIRYTVVSYDVIAAVGGQARRTNVKNGYQFNDELKAFINAAKKNDMFSFQNIRAQGPDGIKSIEGTVVIEIE